MDLIISFLVLSTLPQLVQPVVPPLLFRTVVEITSGDSKVFSGESVRLRCSILQNNNFTWNYLWFRGSEQLPQNGENIVLWNTNIEQSGKYYCQGVSNSMDGEVNTLKSLPVEISVDGGWAILKVPPRPGLVGESLTLTCHVRGNIPIREAILYKDGVEVLRQQGLGGHLYLTDLTLEDGGLYSCRATWDSLRRTVSVISAATPLQVVEVLTQPIMEIVDAASPINALNMKLVCHVQYNGNDPAPPIRFYFYKNNKQLGTATSQNYVLVTRSPGTFSCSVTVPQMGVYWWSDPKSFGQMTGTQTTKATSFPDSGPRTSPSPAMTLVPSFEPSEVQYSTHPPTAPTMDSTQPSEPPLMTSQSALTIPSPTFQSANNQTVTSEAEGASGGSGEMSGGSGEMSGDFGEISGDSPYADME